MEEYECLMAQLAILFISWQRRHYNKSTLSFLSDLAYQKTFLPEYFRVKLQWLSIITEKKVEVFHSLLRKDTESLTQDLKYRTLQEQLVHLDSLQNLKNGCSTISPRKQ